LVDNKPERPYSRDMNTTLTAMLALAADLQAEIPMSQLEAASPSSDILAAALEAVSCDVIRRQGQTFVAVYGVR
jgi:hypothetical protein